MRAECAHCVFTLYDWCDCNRNARNNAAEQRNSNGERPAAGRTAQCSAARVGHVPTLCASSLMSLVCFLCAVCVLTLFVRLGDVVSSTRPVSGQRASLRSARCPPPALPPSRHNSNAVEHTPRTFSPLQPPFLHTTRTQRGERQRFGSEQRHNRRTTTSSLPTPLRRSAAAPRTLPPLPLTHHVQSVPSSCTARSH
jgi:hypothetical protein